MEIDHPFRTCFKNLEIQTLPMWTVSKSMGILLGCDRLWFFRLKLYFIYINVFIPIKDAQAQQPTTTWGGLGGGRKV